MPPKSKATAAADKPTYTHWLLKAEPESRLEKGVDVKFSVDDFEAAKTTSWEGVRNHEAKNLMKNQMKEGQACLFYHSSCKVPGIAALAKISREGYPDHNAWDSKHPYFDPKSKADAPTWYMVDLTFVRRLPHYVPLKLLQSLSLLSSPPASTPYLTQTHLEAIKSCALINRGRLSVQPATKDFYEAVEALGENGGWEELLESGKKTTASKGKGKKRTKEETDEEEEEAEVVKPKSKPKMVSNGGGPRLMQTFQKISSNKPPRVQKEPKGKKFKKEEEEKEEEEEEKPKPKGGSRTMRTSRTSTSGKPSRRRADQERIFE